MSGPVFKRLTDGSLRLSDTEEAQRVSREKSITSKQYISLPPQKVLDNAIAEAERLGMNVHDKKLVLGQHRIQFGKYKGQSFRWLVENALGYSAYIVEALARETMVDTPLSHNKFKFKEYLELFPDGREAVEMKQQERLAKLKKTPTSAMSSLMVSRQLSGHRLQIGVKKILSPSKVKPNIPATSIEVPASAETTSKEGLSDDELIHEVEKLEAVHSQSSEVLVSPGCRSSLFLSQSKDVNLPDGWKHCIPKADHGWISRALFKLSSSGRPELDSNKATRLWYDPPQPSVTCSQVPRVDYYFTHRLLLWMPRRLWRVVLRCTQPDCKDQELISAGLYPVVRQVLDIDNYYLLATEKMSCNKCNTRYIGWSGSIVNQLDVGHRLQFPVLLTYRYACDIRVVILMRERGLGNSATQMEKKLQEQHGEAWYKRTLHYLTDCNAFVEANKTGLVVCPSFEEPPTPVAVPKYRWLMNVYCYDVMRRIEEVKSSITSTFGEVLKLDSTKKIVKKLAGHGARTANWMANVGNENGEVLMSVLTSGEGHGLEPMVSGIIRRYKDAKVRPPVILYVDRDCCGNSQLRKMFAAWSDVIIRLDIWHFMRRLAVACTTDSHPLYGIFMGRLSKCIFEWSREDLQILKAAKRLELLAQEIPDPSDEDVIGRLTKKELALHCRRRTRGTEETTRLIQDLLEAFTGDQGLDTLGVPLLDKERVWDIWNSQKRHVACIQDPKGYQLYIQTGTLMKSAVQLPKYRCSRGSTSLESFHYHLNRFIPGNSASDKHFQAYLLEGLVRWNQNRAKAAAEIGDDKVRTYSGLLRHACNTLSTKVLGKRLTEEYVVPNKYTGELIGVDYLYAQTWKVIQEIPQDPDSEEARKLEPQDDAEYDSDEGFAEDEELDDLTVSSPSASSTLTAQPAPQSAEQLTSVSKPHPSCTTTGSLAPVSSPTETTVSAISSLSGNKVSAVQMPAEPVPSTSSGIIHEAEEQDPEESVGPDNVEGFRRVEELSDFLLTLYDDKSMALTNEQASTIIRLWNNLMPYDKRPARLSPRYKTSSPKGHFMRKKGANVVAGVEQTRRCFVGQSGEPAQWPDCNRYMEQLIVWLCHRFPSPEKKNKKTILRWTLVCRAYKKIREKIIGNARVSNPANCHVQLLEINTTTLSTWYNKRTKKLERETIKQGIHLPLPPVSASSPLPLPKVLPITSQPVLQPNNQYIFVLPPNTANQARTRHKQPLPQPQLVQSLQENPVPSRSLSESSREQGIPRSTLWYRKKQYERKQAGELVKSYKRSSSVMRCTKCGNERDPSTHKQFYGSWWCAEKNEENYETWRANISATKSIKKKKVITAPV